MTCLFFFPLQVAPGTAAPAGGKRFSPEGLASQDADQSEHVAAETENQLEQIASTSLVSVIVKEEEEEEPLCGECSGDLSHYRLGIMEVDVNARIVPH